MTLAMPFHSLKHFKRGFVLSAFLAVLWTLTGCHTESSFHFGAYSEAEKFYEKKEFEKAIVKYEQYIRENPGGNMAAISLYYMAKSHEALKHWDKAREIYEKIVKEQSGPIWADFAKARLRELSSQSK